MNVLLLYPETPDTFWSFKHALKYIRKRATSPPLGLLTVAALLPQEWGKRLVDLNVTRLRNSDLAWADCVFVSGMVVHRTSAHEAIARCKEAGLTIVAGGPLFTAEHEAFTQVDHFVLNEAEITLPRFLADFERGRAEHIYATTEFSDIAETPTPLWELADMSRYASMSIQYSRGCPYHCDFCNVTALFGHRPRVKSANQVIAELDSLYDSGWRGRLFFVDDNFIGKKRHLKAELLPALIDWQKDKGGMPLHTEASIDLADDEELMAMMVEAGFDAVFIGIETPDDLGLAECAKVQNRNRDLVADVQRIQHAGLQVQGGFILGFDSDTASIFQRQIDFIQRSGIVTAMVGLLQAIPGTKLYERLAGEGRVRQELSGDNVDGTTNIVPTMSIEALREGYEAVLRHIYSPKHYYKRLRTFLREYHPPKIKAPIRFEDIRALCRSVVCLGILGKERLQYWKLLLWTGFRRPELFSLAVTLAIYGQHYRKVCELHVF